MWILEYLGSNGYLGMTIPNRMFIENIPKDNVRSAVEKSLEHVKGLKEKPGGPFNNNKYWSFSLVWLEAKGDDIDEAISCFEKILGA